MEERKQKEIEYYEKKAQKWQGKKDWEADFEGFQPLNLKSYQFCYQLLEEKCESKRVLDYGCGNGIHSIPLAKMGAKKVIGIDLSEKSLEIAKEKAERKGLADKIIFLKMDCEKMEFPENFFDIIFDGGTFSSLDLKLAFPELARVLKPDGFLIGIETFGHNFITNLKRTINKLRGKRTEWATGHILKIEDLKEAQNYFGKVDTKFFHLISWVVFPFLSLLGAKSLLKFIEAIDRILLKLPFLRKYAFKIVFIFSNPKNVKEII